MKKKEKYYPVNKQEDEDGYAGYPANAITTKTEKARQKISSRDTIVSAGISPARLQFRNISLRFK